MNVLRKIKSIVMAFALLIPFYASAQNSEFDNLKVYVLMPENQNISNELLSSLQNRLCEAVSLNCMGAVEKSNRFVLKPVVNIVSKTATTSIPPQFIAEVEIALYFADNQEKTILSQTVIVKKGMAESDDLAVAKAIKSLQARDKKIKRLFDEGKVNLANFFETHNGEVKTDMVNDSNTDWILLD